MTDDSDRRGSASSDDEAQRAREGAGAAPEKGPAHEFPPEKGRDPDRMAGEEPSEAGRESVEAITYDRERLAGSGSQDEEPRSGQDS
jgi:hypothetical protein